MLYINSGNVKEGRMRRLQDWLAKNEGMFQKHAPPGWTYKGTYAYVLGFGRFQVASLWECRTYGDFDALREHDDAEWMSLNEQMSDFFTPEPGESVLLREMGDTKILEPAAEE